MLDIHIPKEMDQQKCCIFIFQNKWTKRNVKYLYSKRNEPKEMLTIYIPKEMDNKKC